MILDYIAILQNDATLQALLKAGGSNKKVFPLVARDGEVSPWVVYSTSTQGSSEDVIDEAMIHIGVYAETYPLAISILNRIIVLLDLYEGAKSITSTDFRFLYSKLVPGGTETREDDTRLYHLVRTFHVKYKRRSGG